MGKLIMNKEKIKVSVICIFNNENQLKKQLKTSLEIQNLDFEWIAIDNSNNRFRSAAEALNYGSRQSKGDILIYSHQDIFLKRDNELRKFVEAINECEVGSIVGTQGVIEPRKVYYSNLTAGTSYNSTIVEDYEEKLYEVSCVDEGFFGMKKETWNMLQFDEDLCDNWHLYCVEMCLHTRKQGHKVYVYPSQIHHFSMGTITLGYMRNLKKMCEVYRKDFKYIWTTCYKVKTNKFYINSLFFVWYLNRKIHKKL